MQSFRSKIVVGLIKNRHVFKFRLKPEIVDEKSRRNLNYEGIPPLFICVGTHEIHFDNSVNVAKVVEQHGVEVTLRKWKNMIHAFPLLTPLFPEAKKAFLEMCEFIKHYTYND